MSGLLSAAIDNAAALCALVHRAHGHDSALDAALWSCRGAPLPFYPNVVTLTPGPSASAALAAFLGGDPFPRLSWGIKDSWSDQKVVGRSNVYSVSGEGPSWGRVAAFLRTQFPDQPLVGWRHAPEGDAAANAGFTRLGPLRVWIRPGPSALP